MAQTFPDPGSLLLFATGLLLFLIGTISRVTRLGRPVLQTDNRRAPLSRM